MVSGTAYGTVLALQTYFYLFDMSSRGKIIQIEFRFKLEKSKIGLSYTYCIFIHIHYTRILIAESLYLINEWEEYLPTVMYMR